MGNQIAPRLFVVASRVWFQVRPPLDVGFQEVTEGHRAGVLGVIVGRRFASNQTSVDQLLPQRAKLMEDWAEYCGTIQNKVLEFRQGLMR